MYDVVIVGAGLAGLTCAKTLCDESPHLSVLIVEARSQIGGRVSTLHNFASCPISLGAEFIHGEHTILKQHLDELGIPSQPIFTWAQGDGGPHPEHTVSGGCGYYYVNRTLYRFDSEHPDFIFANQSIHTMNEDTHQTVYETLVDMGVHPSMMALMNAGYGNTLCSDIRSLPTKESCIVTDRFEVDGNSELDCRGHDALLSYLRKKTEIWTNWPVEQICWKPGFVSITSRKEYITATKVVITVPLSILQQNVIEFCPHLPLEKVKMIHQIRMESCLKLALRFSARFVPHDFRGMICEHGVPEFWTVSNTDEFILMGFATSSYANALHALSRSELKRSVLDQLDEIFDNKASALFIDMMVQDWTNEPYIKGGYSSPSRNEDRNVLAQPVLNTLFFAGEATQPKSMVMHAAMESGIRVSNEIQAK